MDEGKSVIEALKNEGWVEQFVANEPRLSEAVETYRETGFEVHLQPFPEEPVCESRAGEDKGKECRICFEGLEDQYRIIFTRPKKGETKPDNELF